MYIKIVHEIFRFIKCNKNYKTLFLNLLLNVKLDDIVLIFFKIVKQNKTLFKLKLYKLRQIIIEWLNKFFYENCKKDYFVYRSINLDNYILKNYKHEKSFNYKIHINDKNLNIIKDILYKEISNDKNYMLTQYLKNYIVEYINVIDYPYKKRNTSNIIFYYKNFIIEFNKLENFFQTRNMRLYVLRIILKLSKMINKSYKSNDKIKQKKSINLFIKQFYKELHLYLPYFNINIDILLCSLFVFLKKLEGILYKYMYFIDSIKNKNLIISSLQTNESR